MTKIFLRYKWVVRSFLVLQCAFFLAMGAVAVHHIECLSEERAKNAVYISLPIKSLTEIVI